MRSVKSSTVIASGVSIVIVFIFIHFYDWQHIQQKSLVIWRILYHYKRIILFGTPGCTQVPTHPPYLI